jgi:hypothetical protein
LFSVVVDQFGSWPTLIKPRKAMALAAESNNNNNSDDTSSSSTSVSSFSISTTSLLEAAASTLSRSNSNCWQSNIVKGKNNSSAAPVSKGSASNTTCFWCPAAALTKNPEAGSGMKQLPQGFWNVVNPKILKKPLQLAFSMQLCVALVEVSSQTFPVEKFSPSGDEIVVSEEEIISKLVETNKLLSLVDDSSNTNNNVMIAQSSSASSTLQPASPLMNNNSKKQQQGSPTTTTTENNNDQTEQARRHQEKKAKLIQKKYGEQDDEDRAIALALIGTKKSKAQEKLEKEDQLPTAKKPEVVSSSSKKDKKKKKNVDDEEVDGEDKKAQNDDGVSPVTQQETPTTATSTKTKEPAVARQPRQLSDDAQKNLQEKIQSAASEFMTMRYVSSTSLTSSSSSPTDFSSSRCFLPVLVPLLTMPLNKCRVLLVPGADKRSELAKELYKHFFGSLGEHVGKIHEKFPELVSKISNDDIVNQLPQTAKIQTPFRASLVPLPVIASNKTENVASSVEEKTSP